MKRIFFFIGILLLTLGCQEKKKEAKTSDIYYTCSMHPQVISDKPGKCPICHMNLIAVPRAKKSTTDEIMLSDQQMQLGNIKVDSIRKRMIGKEAILTATLNIDQRNTNAVSARVMGRIDRLHHKNIGDYVRKGEPLFDLYSEELNNAKQEYLLALEKRKTLGNSVVDFQHLVQSAKNKLLLWGLTEVQVRQLGQADKPSVHTTFYSPYNGYITAVDALEGQYVMDGGTILRLAELKTLWAEAQVYTTQMPQIDQNTIAEVQIPGMPGFHANGRIEFVNPETNEASRVTLIRVTVQNQENKLRPGMPAYVTIKGIQNEAITLPYDAIIQDGKGATVWVQTAKNTFKSKMVMLGVENNGFVEITSGLNADDVVVTSGAYLINSEYTFKVGTNPMEGHQH